MIRIYLSTLLGKKKWKQAKLARVTGIRPSTISDMYNELSLRITLDHLDLICEALDCTLDELISYEPNEIRKIERNYDGQPIRPIKD